MSSISNAVIFSHYIVCHKNQKILKFKNKKALTNYVKLREDWLKTQDANINQVLDPSKYAVSTCYGDLGFQNENKDTIKIKCYDFDTVGSCKQTTGCFNSNSKIINLSLPTINRFVHPDEYNKL
jgi:hypothetical protein